MNTPNTHFQDFPIEFKEINPSDFPNYTIANNGQKIIITPNDKGYISKQLLECVDRSEKNTVVINAGVGQGKTTAIIRILNEFYNDTNEDYVIIVASPFVSLVEQYFKEIVNVGIAQNDIYRYEYIGEQPSITYLDKKVHIITVNGILGNPGGNAFINSEAKRTYLNRLSNYCRTQNKKVVLIMDEIHDAIHNFKQEYIFNLWKWKSVLHKNIILSATYNEASKVVMEYLAELTDNKIKIIESERKVIPENQSDLFLHFNPADYYNTRNENIVSVVSDVISRDKEIDILCYSKKLAESIVNDKDIGVGEVLYSKYEAEDIKLCTTKLIQNNRIGRLEVEEEEENTNRFDNTKCNVGTNFKTGISITKRNHAFIIILPPESSKLPFSSASNIFMDGINSVIQALARQRKKGGEIHLILPPPEKFNYDSLPFEGIKKEKFIQFYDLICSQKKVKTKVEYIPYNTQRELVRGFYENTLIDNINLQIQEVNSLDRENRLSLKMPDFKSYLLLRGEKYLASTYKFFGRDLSSFITYSAITNQFLNCNFKGYTGKYPLGFRSGEFQITLDFFFENHYLNEDKYLVYNYGSDMYRYLELKNDLFNNYRLFILKPDNTRITIKEDKCRDFEIQLLGFIHRKLHSSFNNHFLDNGNLFDYKYTKSNYFLSCVAKAENIDLETISEDEELTRRIKTFKNLGYFRIKLIESIQSFTGDSRQFEYIFNKPNEDFITAQEQARFNEMIDYLINKDYFISRNIFEFKQRFKTTFSFSQKVKSFYTKMIEDFLEVEDDKITRGRTRPRVKRIIQVIPLPNSSNTIDLVSHADYNFSDAFWESNTYNVIDGRLIKR